MNQIFLKLLLIVLIGTYSFLSFSNDVQADENVKLEIADLLIEYQKLLEKERKLFKTNIKALKKCIKKIKACHRKNEQQGSGGLIQMITKLTIVAALYYDYQKPALSYKICALFCLWLL